QRQQFDRHRLFVQLSQAAFQSRIALGHDDTKLSQQSTNPIADGGFGLLVALAHMMPTRPCLRIATLIGNETPIALSGGVRTSLGIIAVILVRLTLAKRFDELGGHDPWHKPVLKTTPTAKMSAATRFHGDMGAGGQLSQVSGEGLPFALMPLQDTTGMIDFA